MEKLVTTISNFVSARDYEIMSEKVEDIDSHVKHVHDSLVRFTSDHDVLHEEENEQYNKQLAWIRYDLHRLRVSLRWLAAGLLCSGVAIVALCIHILS